MSASTVTDTDTTTIPLQPATTLWQKAGRLQREYPILQIVVLVALIVIGGVAFPGLLSIGGIRQILVLAAFVGIAAAGQTLVVIIGGIDLSVASMIGAGSFAVSQLPAILGLNFWVVFAGVLILGGIVGGTTGFLSHKFNLNPLILSLGAGALTFGLVFALVGTSFSNAAPAWLGKLSSPVATTFGIPLPPLVVIWIVLAIVIGVVLAWTPLGKRMYATGTNMRAATLARVRTRGIWVGTFAISAMLSIVLGALLAGYAGMVNYQIGDPYLFMSLAAVVVGGNVIGGRGDYNRTIIGVLLITFLNTIIAGFGLPSAFQQLIFGLVILFTVLAYGRERKLRDRI